MNEQFDVEKARELREQATARYRKAARATAYWAAALCVPLLALSSFAATRWTHATDFDQKVLYAILYVLAFAGCLVILLGLEGRLRNVLLMKEIKQLRLDLLESSDRPLGQAVGGVESLGMWKLAGFSRTGIVTTFLLMVIGTSAFVVTLFPTRPEYSIYKSSHLVAADGSMQFVYTLSYIQGGAAPLTELEMTGGSPSMAYEHVWDERGRELNFQTTEPNPHCRAFKIAFAEPIQPGERVSFKVQGISEITQRNGDEWSFTAGSAFGGPYKSDFYFQLPKGAIVTPDKTYTICQDDQGPIVRARKEGRPNEDYRFTIRYRLPHEQQDGTPSKEDANHEQE